MAWLCFYNVIETQNIWILIDLVSFSVGKEWPLGIILFIIHWYSMIPSELSSRSNDHYINFKHDRTLHLLAFSCFTILLYKSLHSIVFFCFFSQFVFALLCPGDELQSLVSLCDNLCEISVSLCFLLWYVCMCFKAKLSAYLRYIPLFWHFPFLWF